MRYVDEDRLCIITGARGVDLHHIRARGMGGNHNPIFDEPWNLLPICHQKHEYLHKIGFKTFVERHPKVRAWLMANGWTLDWFSQKWRHPREKEVNKT